MISTKLHAQQLAALLAAKDITDIVLAPGSRNGPLIHTFAGCRKFDCRTVVDERSAGYFALGLAQKRERPVVLLCSSGTASINFAPAVAEAYHLGVSLVVITADRPQYWIDQLENQCINQQNLYRNSIKKSCTLPLEENRQELWFAARMINELLNIAVSGKKGPVHINIPFEEPLHETVEKDLPEVKNISLGKTETSLTADGCSELATIIEEAGKILVLIGQQQPDDALAKEICSFAQQYSAVILAEHLANFPKNEQAYFQVELLSQAISTDTPSLFQPDLLISCGGQCVSKAVKQFLRNNRPKHHFHIGDDEKHVDTYQVLTKVIPMSAIRFFQQINGAPRKCATDCRWASLWRQKNEELEKVYKAQLKETPFSDMQVYHHIFNAIPENSVVHLGNSSPVRYALLNRPVKRAIYLGNRGTSGIDGSLSTAIGYASVCEKINTVIVGDLSFFYDSNALWNNFIDDNLRIIVVNNGGGNIFGFLEQLERSAAFQDHFQASHQMEAKSFAKTFGLNYLAASSSAELKERLLQFYHPAKKKAALLEVFTEAGINTVSYKKLIAAVKAV